MTKEHVVKFSLFSYKNIKVKANNKEEAKKLAREILDELLMMCIIPFEEIEVESIEEIE